MKHMNAVDFMTMMSDHKAVMEGIDNQTRDEYLEQEANDEQDEFDMSGLLDVNIPSNEEMNQPRIWNSEESELSDYDKRMVINEFTKLVSTMQNDVIDLSDVGPIAVVIQDSLGVKKGVDEFLRETIQKAAGWKDSQSYARTGKQTAGEEIVNEADNPQYGMDEMGEFVDGVDDVDAGTEDDVIVDDIDAGSEDGVILDDVDAGTEDDVIVDDVDAGTEDDVIVDGVDAGTEDDVIVDDIDAGSEDDVIVDDIDAGSEDDVIVDGVEGVGDEGDLEVTDIDADALLEDATEEVTEDDVDVSELSDEEKEDDINDKLNDLLESVRAEKKVNSLVESVKKDIKKKSAIKSKLESIKSNLNRIKLKEKESALDAKLESIKDRLVAIHSNESNVESTPNRSVFESIHDKLEKAIKSPIKSSPSRERAIKATLESVYGAPKAKKVPTSTRNKEIRAKLESVLKEQRQQKKIDATQRQVKAKLESLSKNFHRKMDAIEKDKQVDAKLESLAASLSKRLEPNKKDLSKKLKNLHESLSSSLTKRPAKKQESVDAKLEAIVSRYKSGRVNDVAKRYIRK